MESIPWHEERGPKEQPEHAFHEKEGTWWVTISRNNVRHFDCFYIKWLIPARTSLTSLLAHSYEANSYFICYKCLSINLAFILLGKFHSLYLQVQGKQLIPFNPRKKNWSLCCMSHFQKDSKLYPPVPCFLIDVQLSILRDKNSSRKSIFSLKL